MRHAIILSGILLSAAAAQAEPAAAEKPVCVRAGRDTDYNARPIAQHDILIRNAVGDRRPLRLSTTCVHIYPDAFVAVRSMTLCVGQGDQVAARTIDGHGETCRVAHVAPFVEGSSVLPYK
jgi:hypothetical protein